MDCLNCGSDTVVKKGSDLTKSGIKHRFKCKSCKSHFYSTFSVANDIFIKDNISYTPTYKRDDSWISSKIDNKVKFVITSAQANVDINIQFLKTLENYCAFNGAQLLILPTSHETSITTYPKEIEKYLVDNNFSLNKNVKVLGSIKINSTALNPLSGLGSLSKGSSIVIGHPQLQMMTLPVQSDDSPIIMTTTGTLSINKFSDSKAGYRAGFNSIHSATIVELDGDMFHIRQLEFDNIGVYDFENYYTTSTIVCDGSSVEAIVTGDEHVTFADEVVKEVTYGVNGIVDTLKPKYIVRHDIFDAHSISHHHRNNALMSHKKMSNNSNDVQKEIVKTIQHIIDTTPSKCINVLVASNHNEHLNRWLAETDIKLEPWNALAYHYLMFLTLSHIEATDEIPDVFRLYTEDTFVDNECMVKFLNRSESFKIKGIEIALHGDKGSNGARGTRSQFAMLPAKTIIGHGHSPGITQNCYQTGTSSLLKLEYNQGLSGWVQSHVLIYKNGTRQIINIINGKYRL